MIAADLAILGAGPAGLTAAILASRRGMRVVLCDDWDAPAPVRRVELVPSQIVPLLLELGVDPRRGGWVGTCTRREVAWTSPIPESVQGPPGALIERPRLEAGMLGVVLAQPRIQRADKVRARPRRIDGAWVGDGWTAPRLIDATGRRAIMARSRTRSSAVAWQWMAPGRAGEASFGIAALPGGYAYRLRCRVSDVLGVVTYAAERWDVEAAVEEVRRCGAGWLVDGFAVTEAQAQAPVAAGEQVSEVAEEEGLASVGDARRAREPLTSQGVLAGMTDACNVIDALGRASVPLPTPSRYRTPSDAGVEPYPLHEVGPSVPFPAAPRLHPA